MARLHLRLGSLELARAELEAFAGAGALDADALLDLAEVRWRTGDISGAGVAAQAYLGEGGGEPLALVIAAEASAAAGRPTEARRLASQVVERADVSLDRVFAGIPRSGVWPIEPDERPEPAGELFAIAPTRPTSVAGEVASAGSASVPAAAGVATAMTTSSLWDESGSVGDPNGLQPQALAMGAPSVPGIAIAGARQADGSLAGPVPGRPATAHEPASELEAAREDLAAGRRTAAAARIAVVLRLAPSVAADVLDLLADVPGPFDAAGASLELARGDAYRQVGRETEARRSYAAAAAALPRAAQGAALPPPEAPSLPAAPSLAAASTTPATSPPPAPGLPAAPSSPDEARPGGSGAGPLAS